jgi:hypothetical protein
MVFHGDYEIEFEIHQKRCDDWRTEYLGHVPAMTAKEARERWALQNNLTTEQLQKIEAILPMGYVQV